MASMRTCPICNGDHGVGSLRVWSSCPLLPATCKRCSGQFYPAQMLSAVIAELVFFPFGLMTAFASSSLWMVVAFVLGFAAVMLAVSSFCPLVRAVRQR